MLLLKIKLFVCSHGEDRLIADVRDSTLEKNPTNNRLQIRRSQQLVKRY